MTEARFVFLSQEDVVAAGGLDVAATIDVVEEALRLHAVGDTRLPSKSALMWSDDLGSEETQGRIMGDAGVRGGIDRARRSEVDPERAVEPGSRTPARHRTHRPHRSRDGAAGRGDGRDDRLGGSHRSGYGGIGPATRPPGRARCRDLGCRRPGRNAALGPRGRLAVARAGPRLGHRPRTGRGVPRTLGSGRSGRERGGRVPRRGRDRRRDDGARTVRALRMARPRELVLLGLLARPRDLVRRTGGPGGVRSLGPRDRARRATPGAGARGRRHRTRRRGRAARPGRRATPRPNHGRPADLLEPGRSREDVAAAARVYRRAVELGIGTELALWDSPIWV